MPSSVNAGWCRSSVRISISCSSATTISDWRRPSCDDNWTSCD